MSWAPHPCKCTSCNGGQCYNCLNGAHDICDAKVKCKKRRAKQIGVMLKFTSVKESSK